VEHIDETQNPDHPQAHKPVKKPKSAMPVLMAEIGAALTVGWTLYFTTGDWKQGVGAGLFTLFGGFVHRGGAWYTNRQ